MIVNFVAFPTSETIIGSGGSTEAQPERNLRSALVKICLINHACWYIVSAVCLSSFVSKL